MTWTQTTLSAVSDIQTGPFGSQLHAADYVVSGTPAIMPQNIVNGRISTNGIARVSNKDIKRLVKYCVQPEISFSAGEGMSKGTRLSLRMNLLGYVGQDACV